MRVQWEDRRRSRPESLESLGLTEREAQVVRLLVTGLSNAAIAVELGVSAATVKKHLENVYAKLDVGGRGQLTAFVLGIARHRPQVAVRV